MSPPVMLADVAARLKLVRRVYGVHSQRELAAMLGIKPSRFGQYEAALHLIPVPMAIRLCDMFGVTLDWIYRGDVSGLTAAVRADLASGEAKQ